MIPPFDQTVPRNGYAWWYLDALSDDGRFGLTLIAFIGSVFSPYYAWARDRGQGNPMAHCAINVALYGRDGRWCMTERNQNAVNVEAEALVIGPSQLRWNNDHLAIDIDEWSVPVPRRIQGRIKVYPDIQCGIPIKLDPKGQHCWTPVFPKAKVLVEMRQPGLNWSGSGYLDHNAGSEPLEQGFESWAWSRATTEAGPVVLYDTIPVNDGSRALALLFKQDGAFESLTSPKAVRLPQSHWWIPRPTRSEDGEARLLSAWEDTPFYARSLINIRLLGERVTAVHESLSLQRFKSWWVRLMLPFRMPRRRT